MAKYTYRYLNNFNPRYDDMIFIYPSDLEWEDAEKQIGIIINKYNTTGSQIVPMMLKDRN